VCRFSEVDYPKQPNKNSLKVELVVGDILDADLAFSVTKGMDVIVHLAANTGVIPSVENPRKDCMINVVGTLNYLEAARKNVIKHFIFASSGAPVGECEPPIHEEITPHPVSPYGASKLACEGYCSAYYHTFKIPITALRFGNVYGPLSEEKTSVIAKFIQQAIRGEVLEIFGDGKQTRDFIFIDDLVRAIYLAANSHQSAGEIFQIATNSETNINSLTDRLVNILKEKGIRKVRIINKPPPLGDVNRNFSDVSKALKILGWKSEISLEEGLKRTVEWFYDNVR
jgi:UDP-glucose 4-epimerase